MNMKEYKIHQGTHDFFLTLDAEDDVETGIRTLAIKFSDHHSESPLDLVCYTGYLSPFFTATSVEDYLASLESEEARKNYLYKLPI